MRQRLLSLGVLGIVLSLTSTLSAQSSYIYTTLDCPAGVQTWLYGINNSKQMVGTYLDSGSIYHGFLYKGGVFTFPIDAPGATNTWLYGIDDLGNAVGFSDSSSMHGFVYNAGVFTAVSASGFPVTAPHGITKNSVYGQMIVGLANNGSFLDAGGTFSSVNVPGSISTSATGINAAGNIVGEYEDSSQTFHGFLDSLGSFTYPIDFPGASITMANGINVFGFIVGSYTTFNSGYQGFFYANSSFTTIKVPGSTYTFANGINNVEQIVGNYSDAAGKSHGYLASLPSNPRPMMNQPLTPDTYAPINRGKNLQLTVNGTDFASGSGVYWNGTYISTTLVNSNQLVATIPAGNLTKAGTATVTVSNPYISGGGGGLSNPQFFTVASSHSVTLTRSDIVNGRQPERLVTGDFNADGILDIASTDSPNNCMWVYYGQGNGTFQTSYCYPTGTSPSNLVIADFNNDGKPDLATVNALSNTVSIFLANGTGYFLNKVDFPVGNNPTWLVVGDFNKDGNWDIAAMNQADSTVSILIGNGDGTFHPQTTFTTALGPSSMTVGDFNQDGNVDLAITNFNNFAGNTVSVFLGKGDGTFQPRVDYATASGPLGVVAADLNKDGKLDLAVVAGCGDGTSCGRPGSVSILLGNGNGTFQPKVDYNAGSFPYSIVAADFRSSGTLDLAVTDLDSGSLTFLWGSGTGTFPTSSQVTTNGRPVGLSVGDFNGDGKLDLAVGGDSPAGVSLMLQQ